MQCLLMVYSSFQSLELSQKGHNEWQWLMIKKILDIVSAVLCMQLDAPYLFRL